MKQIANNTPEQAMLGDYPKVIDDAVMDSSEAHQNQMMQLLSDPKKASDFARVVFDLLKCDEFSEKDSNVSASEVLLGSMTLIIDGIPKQDNYGKDYSAIVDPITQYLNKKISIDEDVTKFEFDVRFEPSSVCVGSLIIDFDLLISFISGTALGLGVIAAYPKLDNVFERLKSDINRDYKKWLSKVEPALEIIKKSQISKCELRLLSKDEIEQNFLNEGLMVKLDTHSTNNSDKYIGK